MDEQGLELFGQIVSANVRQTQWATDRVIENKDEQIRDLSMALVLFYKEVIEATESVTTRRLEAAIDNVWVQVDNAKRNLRDGASF